MTIKLKILSLLLLSNLFVNGQEGLSIYLDPSMAINGAYDTSTSGELDLLVKFAPINTYYEEAGVSLEVFKAIEFYDMEFYYNKRLRYGRMEGLYGAGIGLIVKKHKGW